MDLSRFKAPVVVVSLPRSGTHLLIDLIRKQFPSFASYKLPVEPMDFLYLSIEGFLDSRPGRQLLPETAVKIMQRAERPIIKFHTYSHDLLGKQFPEWMTWMEDKGKFIFVVRDVRDVLASYYIFSQSYEHEARVPFKEFIRQKRGAFNRVEYWAHEVECWSSKPGILTVRYESILKETRKIVEMVGDFIQERPQLREPLLPKKVDSIWQFRIHRLFYTRPESTALLGSKDGRKVNWRTELNAEDLAFIRHYSESTMKKFGYDF